MSKRDISLYLEDIKIAIKKIEKYTKEISLKFFESDEKTIDAVVRNLGIIGEAASNIPKEIRNKYADIPWRKIIRMRSLCLKVWGDKCFSLNFLFFCKIANYLNYFAGSI